MRRMAMLGLAAMLLAPPAWAQGTAMFEGLAGQMAMTNLMLEPMRREAARRDREAGRAPPAATTRVVTSYRADPAVSARVMRQFSAFVARQNNTADVAAMEAQLRQADLPGLWQKIWGGDGLRAGDLVDAQASYFLINWIIANGQGDTTRAQTQAVRAQLAGIIAGTPSAPRLTEAQRQEMAEVLILNGAIQAMAYVDARNANDRAALSRLAEAAATRFRSEAQLDLRRLAVTEAGFSAR
ncbi:DUF6683 family protein [Roseomonas sp. 18066]|uniref:DUF6683 family protein n=1 Tax=Roseomonas sp. 18066 TaxID=2681412 RepID=UPI0013592B3C|nr:DUF6683 family protein [Roseomonas sp. 18066]